MEQNEDLSPAIEDVRVAPATETSLRLQVTDLLLGRRRDVRRGRSTREQSDVLRQIEAALEKPTGATSTQPSTANEAVTVPQAVGGPDEELVPGARRALGP